MQTYYPNFRQAILWAYRSNAKQSTRKVRVTLITVVTLAGEMKWCVVIAPQ